MATIKGNIDTQRELYPDIEPFNSGYLKVSEIHDIYFEESGNPNGNPVLFIHGGPGAGVVIPKERCWFDPAFYRIILFDQRGAGRSTPLAELRENTTWDLLEDIEKLRNHLSIKSWVLFGCSWGSTLALIYAEEHPDKVKAIIIQGIFLCTRKEIEWFYSEGASMVWPDLYEDYVKVIPKRERCDMISAYYRRLTSTDKQLQQEAAKAWSKWELATLRPQVDPDYIKYADNADFCLHFARIECHYFVNGAFLESDNWILENADKIRDIPTTIINGRFDIITPMAAAWNLHKALPKSELVIVPLDGHSDKDSGIRSALLDASDKYRTL